MTEQASGIKKVTNLGGGLNTGPKTQVPEISWTSLKNFNVDHEFIRTRDGMDRVNSAAFWPGCVQFGYADDQRVHYLKAEGGDFGPQQPGTTQQSKWGMYFYSKELVATTEARTLVTLATGTTTYIQIGWDTSNRLECQVRPTDGEALQTVAEAAGGESVSRTATTAQLYGVTMISDVANTVEVTLWNSYGARVAESLTFSDSDWDKVEDLILGSDINTNYPDSDWSNAENRALYGYMGEVLIVRDKPYDIINTFYDMKTSPGQRVPTRSRVAHYSLSKNYTDEWGISPAFSSPSFQTGGGNSNYSVSDLIIDDARDILFNTKSWEVDTFGVNAHVYGQTNSLSSRYRNYLNAVGTTYTFTFDILPVRQETGTFTLLEATTAGPYIKISKKTSGESQVEFGHVFNASNTVSVTYNLNNNYVSKISCQYGHSDRVATTIGLKIFQDTMKVATTISTLTSSTVPVAVGNLKLGVGDVTSISSNFFVSGLVLHNVRAGDAWGDRPQETFENVTTYTTVVRRRRKKKSGFSLNIGGIAGELLGFGSSSRESYEVNVPSGSKAERQGEGDLSFSIFDLPYRENAVGGWLFTDSTGFDTASNSTPHGIISNIFSTSTTDGSDFILRGNSSALWVADRNDAGLPTTGYLDHIYEDDADSTMNYTPVNPTLSARIFVSRNSQLVDTNGNKFVLGDNYKYTQKESEKVRGFTYGNSLYIHNSEYYLRFNGNEIRPVEVVSPSIPITLTADSTPSTGLNGAYKYSYTFVDKSGVESYPALPTSVTVSTGSIAIALNPKITNASYLNVQVQEVNIYRNKGGTTATTVGSLAVDADKSLYLLKTVPLSAVKAASGATLFTDTTADTALGGNPPEPDTADPVPPCKYATVFRDTVIMTGDERSPNVYYQSAGQSPEILGFPGVGEFLTENGEQNVGVSGLGSGFVIFKENSRKFVRGGVGGESYEYHNGGCMSHDTLITIGSRVVGLGPNGFFISDGHSYDDLTTVRSDGREVSSIQEVVDEWSSAVKRAAFAVYHTPTKRYICHVNSKYYVFSFIYKVWTEYEDMVGLPFVFDNDFYLYKKGFLNKESSSQAYVGTTRVQHSVGSGDVGKFQVVSTTTLPSTTTSGLPCYVGTTFYWVTSVSQTGTTNDIYVDTNKDFSNADSMTMGIINHHADTKFFQMRTPNRNKIFKKLHSEHGNTEDGVIKIRLARNSGDFSDASDHYVADTDIEKINTVLRVRSENMAVRFAVEDGKEHVIRNYEIVFDQESVL